MDALEQKHIDAEETEKQDDNADDCSISSPDIMRPSNNIFVCGRCGKEFKGISRFRTHITRQVKCIDSRKPAYESLLEHDSQKTRRYIEKIDELVDKHSGGDIDATEAKDSIRKLISAIKGINLYDDRNHFNTERLNEYIDSTKARLSDSATE